MEYYSKYAKTCKWYQLIIPMIFGNKKRFESKEDDGVHSITSLFYKGDTFIIKHKVN